MTNEVKQEGKKTSPKVSWPRRLLEWLWYPGGGDGDVWLRRVIRWFLLAAPIWLVASLLIGGFAKTFAEVGAFGDSMAFLGIGGAVVALIVSARSLQVQSEDYKAQLKALTDSATAHTDLSGLQRQALFQQRWLAVVDSCDRAIASIREDVRFAWDMLAHNEDLASLDTGPQASKLAKAALGTTAYCDGYKSTLEAKHFSVTDRIRSIRTNALLNMGDDTATDATQLMLDLATIVMEWELHKFKNTSLVQSESPTAV
jgi:hypothetical protein